MNGSDVTVGTVVAGAAVVAGAVVAGVVVGLGCELVELVVDEASSPSSVHAASAAAISAGEKSSSGDP